MSEPIRQADSGVVTPAELEEITARHIRGEWEPWELQLGRWEI